MDLAVIIPELCKYGGAEKYVLECVRRWQGRHRLTLYAASFDEKLLRDRGIGEKVALRTLHPYFGGEHGLLLNSILLPKIWEREIGYHEGYQAHLWPTHLIDRHPMVWFPHEPLRLINDLRFEQPLQPQADDIWQHKVHMYPKASYDLVSLDYESACFDAVMRFEKTGRPDAIVANSRYCAEYIESVYGCKAGGVVYPGVNVKDFFYLPPCEKVVLSVSQLWQHKRIHLLIESMKYLDETQLYIVGDGPERQTLQQQVDTLGLSGQIFFLGHVTDEELAILYARAYCVAFVPVREPFGIVALEAMAAGKPLVAVKEGGFTEAVPAEGVVYVEPMPPAIAAAIRNLLNDPAMAAEMGRRNLEAVSGFSWDRTAAELERITVETVEKNASRARPETGEARTLTGIDYFVWYGKGAGQAHWNDNLQFGAVTEHPWLGYYASDSGEIIRRHLQMMIEAGLDFVAANVHIGERGVDFYELSVAERIADIIETDALPIKCCVQVCPYTFAPDTLATGIEEVKQKLFGRQSYLRAEGQPVVWLFWSGMFDGDRAAIDGLRRLFDTAILLIASMQHRDGGAEQFRSFDLGDGWSLFSPLEVGPKATWKTIWQRTYENGMKRRFRCFSCSPGYDDRVLTDPRRTRNLYRHVDREEGAVFADMLAFAAALSPRPHFVKIVSFNEFHEGSHIEPTMEVGDKYLGMLKAFCARMKGGEGRA